MLSSPPMATPKRNLITGSALFLAGWLAFCGMAEAHNDPMTGPAEAALFPAAWSPQEGRWAEIFGQPAENRGTPKVVNLALATERAPVRRPLPVAAYSVRLNEHVKHYLGRFQTGYVRTITEGRLARSGRYLPMILDVFKEKGLPEELVFTAMVESGFNPVAVSHAGAKGLWQFMAPTARLYGLRVDRWLDERLDPEKSTVAAANYLRDLYNTFGSWELAQAAYNAGEVRVQQAIQGTGSRDFWVLHRRSPHLLPETKNFVPAIQAATLIGRHPERYGFTVTPEEPMRYEIVTVPKSTRLARLAATSGVALVDLEQLNPELWQKQTPPDSTYELKVPVGTVVSGQTAIQMDAAPRKIAPAPGAGVHVVKSGDTLWRIARDHGISVAQIARWNDLGRPDRIYPGERLRVSAPSATS